MEKICTKCGLTKSLEEFNKHRKGKFGRAGDCRACKKAYSNQRYIEQSEKITSVVRSYQRTPKGWATARWCSINQRTTNGKYPNWNDRQKRRYLDRGVRIELLKQDFIAWVIRNWQRVLDLWAAGEIPSIERINPADHYSIDNIEIISLRENARRARRARAIN